MDHWNPVRELLDLHPRLDRALGALALRPLRPPRRRGGIAGPPIDLGETPGAFVLRADVPGAKRDDLRVTVHEGVLELAGEAPPVAVEQGLVRRAERARGPFRRLIPLPREADPAAVTASLADGVLTVTVAKRVPDGGRPVTIE